MILLSILAAASTAAASPPSQQAQPGFARAYVEAQLAQRARKSPQTGLSGAEAAVMRKSYLDQLAAQRQAEPTQTSQTRQAAR